MKILINEESYKGCSYHGNISQLVRNNHNIKPIYNIDLVDHENID